MMLAAITRHHASIHSSVSGKQISILLRELLVSSAGATARAEDLTTS